jgi:membrane fusion protein (multidrug efflux system)
MLSRLCIVLLVIVLGCGGCAKKGPGSPAAAAGGGARQKQVVEVAPVTRRDLVDTLTVIGSLAANESAELRPEMSGLVQEIRFDEGQIVKRGDVLLKIEDTELRAQYDQTEARFQLAELNVARSETLSKTKTIPESEADRARSEFAVAKAELALLRTRLDKTEVKAPFDGVVGGRVVSPGDYVTSQTVITTLDDLTRLKVEFQVPERYLDKVTHDTTFNIWSSAIDRSNAVRGDVYFVSPVIDRNTRSSEIKGLLDHPPPALKPGMFTYVDLILDVRKAALTVPEGSILLSSSGTQVITVREEGGESLAEFVSVTLGMRVPGLVEVTSAKGTFGENTSVVAAGVGALILYPGARLEPRPLRPEFQIGQ